MKLGELVKAYRKEHDMSITQFAKLTGLSKMYLSMLERNYNPSTGKEILPSTTTFQKCAHAMGISVDELLSKLDNDQLVHVIMVDEGTMIKTHERMHNLKDQLMCDVSKFNVPTDVLSEPGFSFVLDDDSMVLSRIRKGDIIYAHSDYYPINNGDVLVVVLPHTNVYTLRRAYPQGETLILRADNPEFKTEVFTNVNIDSLLIVGKAVKCLFNIK